ncbi:hypothetical protein MMA231_00923 [Asticcacaulis sp. MM231]|jgi:hypothetical protein|uniref:hypothetical protein n=1 Tax=Asticcacaulis sp. MM231 TaxID=3157666 RepID=UPI0032D581FF
MSSIEALSACTSPLQTAIIFNPTRPEYYRADELKAAKAEKAAADPAVTITLSDQAQAKLKR